MLKQEISYIDFNDEQASEVLYFNLTKMEVADNLHLVKPLEDLQAKLQGDGSERNIEPEEIILIMDMVKHFMRISYGLRSSDGKRFIKNDENWTEFTQTAAYDAFLYSLFENPAKMVSSLLGIMPPELREQAKQTIPQQAMDVINDGADPNPAEDKRPAFVRENRYPRKDELDEMGPEEFNRAMVWTPK